MSISSLPISHKGINVIISILDSSLLELIFEIKFPEKFPGTTFVFLHYEKNLPFCLSNMIYLRGSVLFVFAVLTGCFIKQLLCADTDFIEQRISHSSLLS